jgi:predicted TIM-barrel fold metal-dependent hydrolase
MGKTGRQDHEKGRGTVNKIIVDADTHVTEPADLWTSRVPARMAPDVPQVRLDPRGYEVWLVRGRPVALTGMGATAGSGTIQEIPKTRDEALPAAYDPTARLRYMDENGVAASVLYPNVLGFSCQRVRTIPDEEVRLACVTAYNDWLAEWASHDRDRLLPIAGLPLWDVAASVRELRRAVALGHRGFLFSGRPQAFGYPVMGDRRWDPLWACASELGVPASLHIGSGDTEARHLAEVACYGPAVTLTMRSIDTILENACHIAELLLSGVPARFPGLRFVSVESGLGWIPFVLDALDYQFRQNDLRFERGRFDMLPSEYFTRQVAATFWFEDDGVANVVRRFGASSVMIGSDFPHPTCLYGQTLAEQAQRVLGGLPAETRSEILAGTGNQLYRRL